MNDTLSKTVGIRNDERRNLPFFHECQGSGGEGTAVDGAGVGIHDLAGSAFEGVRAVAFEEAAEVSVGDHAEELASVCSGGGEDCGHA